MRLAVDLERPAAAEHEEQLEERMRLFHHAELRRMVTLQQINAIRRQGDIDRGLAFGERHEEDSEFRFSRNEHRSATSNEWRHSANYHYTPQHEDVLIAAK